MKTYIISAYIKRPGHDWEKVSRPLTKEEAMALKGSTMDQLYHLLSLKPFGGLVLQPTLEVVAPATALNTNPTDTRRFTPYWTQHYKRGRNKQYR